MIAALLLSVLAQPPAGQQDVARRAFDRGMQHYNLGEFARAIQQFKASYEASPHAELLFDIGQCHRNLGNYERAIFFFERYVEESPTDSDQVHALLTELRARENRHVVYDPPPLTTATTGPARIDLGLALAPPPPRDDEKPVTERWWFWAAVTGAAAFAAGSVVLVATLTEDERDTLPRPVFNPQ